MPEAANTPAQGQPPAQAEAPAPGTPEHDAAMAKVAEARMNPPAASGEQPQKPAKPEGVPEKFWDAEKGVVRVDDLAKSYRELESKLGQKPAATTPQKAGENLSVEQKAAADQVAKAGLDMEALNTEFAEKGALSPETYAKLEQGGIPKAMVDSYIEGQKAIAAQYTNAAHEAAGGAEHFTAMQQWAASNVPKAELDAYNEAVTSGDVAKMRLAVQGLRARHVAAEGERPKLVQGGNTPPGAVTGYNSRQEMTADMRKPEYKKDPAFRKQVEARVAATTAF